MFNVPVYNPSLSTSPAIGHDKHVFAKNCERLCRELLL